MLALSLTCIFIKPSGSRIEHIHAYPANPLPLQLRISNMEFSAYIRSKGYNIIPISGEDQLKYGCNILNLGQSTVLSVHEKTARQVGPLAQATGRTTTVARPSPCGVP